MTCISSERTKTLLVLLKYSYLLLRFISVHSIFTEIQYRDLAIYEDIEQ